MSRQAPTRVKAATQARDPVPLKIEIRREIYTGKSTIGRLFLNGEFECYTLEDCARGEATKVPGATSIPAGTYRLAITFSNRFQRQLPQLLQVPGFEGIRIHPGNTDADTEGCILVGQTQAENFVGKSRLAFNQLFAKLQAAAKAGAEVRVTVADTRVPGELSSSPERPA